MSFNLTASQFGFVCLYLVSWLTCKALTTSKKNKSATCHTQVSVLAHISVEHDSPGTYLLSDKMYSSDTVKQSGQQEMILRGTTEMLMSSG